MVIFEGVLEITEYATWLHRMDWPLLIAKLNKWSSFIISLEYLPTIFFPFLSALSPHVLPMPRISWFCPLNSLCILTVFSKEMFLPALCQWSPRTMFSISSENNIDSLQVMTISCCNGWNVCVPLKLISQKINPGVMKYHHAGWCGWGTKLWDNYVMRVKPSWVRLEESRQLPNHYVRMQEDAPL